MVHLSFAYQGLIHIRCITPYILVLWRERGRHSAAALPALQ